MNADVARQLFRQHLAEARRAYPALGTSLVEDKAWASVVLAWRDNCKALLTAMATDVAAAERLWSFAAQQPTVYGRLNFYRRLLVQNKLVPNDAARWLDIEPPVRDACVAQDKAIHAERLEHG